MNASSARASGDVPQSIAAHAKQERVLRKVNLHALSHVIDLPVRYNVHVCDLAASFGIPCQMDRELREKRQDQAYPGFENKWHLDVYQADPGMLAWEVRAKLQKVAIHPVHPADTRLLIHFAHKFGADVFPFDLMGLGSVYYADDNTERYPLLERSEGIWRIRHAPFPELKQDSTLAFLAWF